MENSTLSNSEIVDIYLKNRMIKQCVECQMSKIKDRQFEDDLFQDTVLWLLTYDNKKLNDAHKKKHMNALITKYLINNIFSKTSPYYKNYYKQQNRELEITPKELDIPDEI